MSTNWQDRISNHEETPPKGVWENIAKMLDEEDEKKAPVISIDKKRVKLIYWRIAGAACIAGIIATIAIWLNADNKTIKSNPSVASVVPANPSIEKNNQSESIPVNNHPTVSAPKKIGPVNPFSNNVAVNTKIEYATTDIVKPLATDPSLNKKEKLINTTGDIQNDISLMTPPNNYVSFTGPNGQEVKVSSKFSNLLGYMDGQDPEAQEYLDKIINESNLWRGKFKNWRNKMMNNSVAPSPSNFMDIIELSKLLSEEK